MRCEWVTIKDRVYQCRRCGKIIAAAPGIEPRWDRMPDCKGPTATKKAFNYAAAVVRWIEAGRPVRPSEEVERLLAICRECEYYADNACRKCGCRLAGRHALVSKLKMATEHCPIGRW